MLIAAASEIAEFVSGFHRTGTVVFTAGDDLPVTTRAVAPVAAPTVAVPPKTERPDQQIDDAKFLEAHLGTLLNAGANPVERAFAAHQIAGVVARLESTAHDATRMQQALNAAQRAEVTAKASRSDIDLQLQETLGRIYRDPVAASQKLGVVLSIAEDRLVATREIPTYPEILGPVRTNFMGSPTRDARQAAKALAVLINERTVATQAVSDALEDLGAVRARTSTPEARRALSAYETLSTLGSAIGLTTLPSPTSFLALSSEAAIKATVGDLIGAKGLPAEFVARTSDQMARADAMRSLEQAIPPQSPLADSAARAAARKTAARVRAKPHTEHGPGHRLSPVDRFKAAADAVEKNEAAAEQLAAEGDVIGAETASRWSARASAHLVDAATAIKADYASLKLANETGLLPQVETVLHTAFGLADGAVAEMSSEMDMDGQ